MSKQLTADDARQSLTGHVEAKGVEIYLKYGPVLGWEDLPRLLADRAYVRYPCEIVFDATPLLPGEFAHPMPKTEQPEDGFTMYVHPVFETQLDRVPALVLYQLVAGAGDELREELRLPPPAVKALGGAAAAADDESSPPPPQQQQQQPPPPRPRFAARGRGR